MDLIILVAILAGSIVLALNRINDKLKKFPGPFIAKFTSLWQLYDQYIHIHDEPNVHHTRKYGSIVRVAPNKLYLSDAAATRELLATANNLNKVSSTATFADVKSTMLIPIVRVLRLGRPGGERQTHGESLPLA